MEIIKIDNLNLLDLSFENCCATLGFFDGVHLGHDALLKKLESQENKKLIITFDSHPNKKMLLSLDEKLKLFEQYDIDYCLVIQMNDINQNISADVFISIMKKLKIYKFIVGEDVKFGQEAKGDVYNLKNTFSVEVFPYIEGKCGKICSSTIRMLIDKGEFEEANYMLNHVYKVSGVVRMGRQIGRTINFPTINIKTLNYIPGNGVYITKTYFDNKEFYSVTNIGYQPTVGGNERLIETHIFDFNEEIYGKFVSVEFKKLIRLEKKFESLDDLKEQIQIDVNKAKEYYGNKKIS